MKKVFFNNKEFLIQQGSTHPEYSYFTFEKEESDFRDKYWKISSGDTVLDIGSSYGAYALTACAMGARVYAFEPEKTVFVDLEKNIELNNWKNKCFPYNIGFWDKESSVNMKSYAPHWPEFSITSDYDMTTLDKFVEDKNINKIDWIKIDVEGAEEKVILGGLNTLKKFKPKLIVECHVFLDKNLKDKITKLLNYLDYQLEEVSRDPCIMLISH